MKYRYDKALGRVVEKPESEREVIEPFPVPQFYGAQAARLVEELKAELIYGRRSR